jgi:hypothetical protein
METPKARSLFELEAERIAALNKHKNVPKNNSTFMEKLAVLGFGAGFAIFIFAIVFVPLTIYTMFAHGYVAMKIWQWYVVPAFGLAPISWVVGGALMLLVRLFTYTVSSAKSKKDESTLNEKVLTFVAGLLVPWYTLFIAWAFHFFM